MVLTGCSQGAGLVEQPVPGGVLELRPSWEIGEKKNLDIYWDREYRVMIHTIVVMSLLLRSNGRK